MKHVAIALLVPVVLGLAAFAADNPQPTDILNQWVGGKWSGSGDMTETDYSHAISVTFVTNCAWSPNHVVVICDQVVNAKNKPDREIAIYSYDPEGKQFHFYEFSPDQPKPRTPDLVIRSDGRHWEYLNTATIKGKDVKFRTTNNFVSKDEVEWWTDYSVDGGEKWIKMGGGKETRH